MSAGGGGTPMLPADLGGCFLSRSVLMAELREYIAKHRR